MQDGQLLRQYVEAGSEAAFSQIVKRHLNLVYAVCRRETEDAALAEDITQVVFLLLARKAPALRRESTLAGWLFQTARFACKNAKRQEQRRRQREQKIAEDMRQDLQPDNAVWNELEPFVNQALAALNPSERDAVLLRVLEGHSLAETGAMLGLSEEAARKRVARALEKVRRHLVKQGVVVTSLALAALLSRHAVQAAPPACANLLAPGLLTARVSTLMQGALKAMWITKANIAATLFAIILAVTGLPPLASRLHRHHPPPRPAVALPTPPMPTLKIVAVTPRPMPPKRGLPKSIRPKLARPPRLAVHSPALPTRLAAKVAVPRPPVPTALPVAPQVALSLPLIPQSLHIVYSMTQTYTSDKSTWTIPAELWLAAPNRARWTIYGKFVESRLTDGSHWTALSIDTAHPDKPTLRTEPANSWRDTEASAYGPGVMAGEIPFLGFRQPGKVYRSQESRIVKTATGWQEHCQVPHGYARLEGSGKPALVDALLTYDRRGRLIRFQRDLRSPGTYFENYDYADFMRIGDADIPQTITFSQRFRDAPDKPAVTEFTTVYRVKSMDAKPILAEIFAPESGSPRTGG